MIAAVSAQAPPKTRGKVVPSRSSSAPIAAPAINSNTEATRRPIPGLEPPAREESAASPVNVSVILVGVRSGMASRLIVALRKPIATAVRPITA
jgi:hypothetical protein